MVAVGPAITDVKSRTFTPWRSGGQDVIYLFCSLGGREKLPDLVYLGIGDACFLE
jgi:hypothetical protein